MIQHSMFHHLFLICFFQRSSSAQANSFDLCECLKVLCYLCLKEGRVASFVGYFLFASIRA